MLTLVQTEKTRKFIPILLFGKEYWNEVINFEALVKWGVIGEKDLDLFHVVDTVPEAVSHIKEALSHRARHRARRFSRHRTDRFEI